MEPLFQVGDRVRLRKRPSDLSLDCPGCGRGWAAAVPDGVVLTYMGSARTWTRCSGRRGCGHRWRTPASMATVVTTDNRGRHASFHCPLTWLEPLGWSNARRNGRVL